MLDKDAADKKKLRIIVILEKFDNNPQVKEKGRINVNFRDKDPHFSQKSAQPYQVYQY